MELKTHLEEQRGRASALAKDLNLSPVTIHNWVVGRKQVPAERCSEIEKATLGAVRCEDLRPDLAEHWAFLRGTAKETA